jgi:hypothetical protein
LTWFQIATTLRPWRSRRSGKSGCGASGSSRRKTGNGSWKSCGNMYDFHHVFDVRGQFLEGKL